MGRHKNNDKDFSFMDIFLFGFLKRSNFIIIKD